MTTYISQIKKGSLMKGIIYIAKNTLNNKCYIGQTTQDFNKYKKSHIRRAMSMLEGNNRIFYRAIRKYGKDVFIWIILEDNISDELELYNKEQFYIEKYNSTNIDSGYNMTTGGLHYSPNKEVRNKISKKLKGIKRDDSFKKKISETLKGHITTEETKQKLRDCRLGSCVSDFVKQRISETHKGKKISEKTKQKMSASHKGTKLSEITKNKIREARKKQVFDQKSIEKVAIKTKERHRNNYLLWKNKHNETIKNDIKNGFYCKKDLYKPEYGSFVYFDRCFKELYEEVYGKNFKSKFDNRKSVSS